MRFDFEKLGRWILGHRLIVILVIAALSVASLVSALRTPLRTSIIKGFLADDKQYQNYRQSAEALGGNSDDLVYVATVEGPSLLSREKLNAIRRAVDELEQMPEVNRVHSLVDSPWLATRRMSIREIAARSILRRQIEQGKVPRIPANARLPVYWPRNPQKQTDRWIQRLKQTLPSDDPFVRFFLSPDLETQALLIVLHNAADLETTVQETIRKRIEAIVRSHGLGKQGYYATGILITQAWMLNQAAMALKGLFPIGVGVIFLLVYMVFGRISYTLLTLSIALIAIIWAFGVTSLCFGEVSILVAASPLLILVIATADTIHLASAYLEEIRRGIPKQEAVIKVFREVGGACLLTSLTTFLGFLSLAVVPASTIRHVSLALAVGVASALLLALTLVPITLSLLPVPDVRRREPIWQRGMDKGMNFLVGLSQRLALGSPRLIVLVHAVILVVAVFAAQRIVLDVDFAKRFPVNHEFRQSADFFEQNLYGTNSIEVVIQGEADRIFQPGSIRALARLEEKLMSLEEVDRVLSLPTLYRSIANSLGAKWENGLPQSRESALAVVQLVEQWSSGTAQTLVSRSRGITRLTVHVKPRRILKIEELSARIEAIAKETVNGDLSVQMAGSYPVLGRAVKHIIRTQFQGFLLCFGSVMFVIAVGIRSIRATALAAIPNLLPLMMLGLLVGLTTPVMDTDIIAVAIVSFGLAVDDTIHFLHRFELEKRNHASLTEAIERTYRYTGRAIVRTTVVLGTGLLPFAFSEYFSIWLLGTYLVFVLAMAVIGDLLLLPALLLLFAKKQSS